MRKFLPVVTAAAIAATTVLSAPAAHAFGSAAPAAPHKISSDVMLVAQSKVLPQKYKRKMVRFVTNEAPGTIIIDTSNKFLYYVEGNNRATRYGVGVGRDGFGWSGVVKVGRKAEWPSWTPPAEMRVRERKAGRILPITQEGGINNPLGARALYLYQNGHDTIFRIHGTNQPWTIGQNMSSGCIRLMNKDVEHLYERAGIGTKVIVVGPGNKQGDVSYQDKGLDVFRTLFGGG
ncbi:L,D-transpeptidase [Rhizobiaceae bacterium n13]|uniref:L,D-transpeptidase n=1 Tax=Ferirhizobium litorale TaxID=2927786 RepID=A0AAE3QD92_9HYPH|nr:L,D-transpeptidase [Fererhizobium litorale]MDI7864801.1 L,D-transpeptidase [Fererhizobium litorale]MDI7921713.1 L,D-transpeptidase [Fererhizobium litorale]